MKLYKSIDHILVDQPTDPSIRDASMEALKKDKNPRLVVTIDATHSGVLTNRRVYPAKHVSTGYKSYFSKANGGTAEYDKPVLKHHELHDDAIGRITKAVYTPLKTGLDFDQDFKRPDPVGSKGSGVVTVTANITDPESIQKIIDGRYITVSAGHSTDSMTCSICNKSIMSPKCDHWAGKYYNEEGEECEQDEGFLCFFITGNMTYDELSFVNMPAQPPAKLMTFNWEDFNKSNFEKDNLIVTSMTRGKKSLVRDFSLTDDDGEFNLLQGLHTDSKKKVVIAMSQNEASKNCNQPEVIQDVLPDNKGKDNAAKNSTIASNSRKDTNNMDQPEKKNGLDTSTLEASLTAMTDKVTALELAKKDFEQKIAALEANLGAKNSEIERLTKAQTDSQLEISKAYATALASVRIRLGKSEAAGLDSAAKFDEYVAKLAKRSSDSLRDSIADTVQELGQAKDAPAPNKDGKSANNLVTTGDKVSPVTQVTTDKKEVRAGNENTKTRDIKSALDKAFE